MKVYVNVLRAPAPTKKYRRLEQGLPRLKRNFERQKLVDKHHSKTWRAKRNLEKRRNTLKNMKKAGEHSLESQVIFAIGRLNHPGVIATLLGHVDRIELKPSRRTIDVFAALRLRGDEAVEQIAAYLREEGNVFGIYCLGRIATEKSISTLCALRRQYDKAYSDAATKTDRRSVREEQVLRWGIKISDAFSTCAKILAEDSERRAIEVLLQLGRCSKSSLEKTLKCIPNNKLEVLLQGAPTHVVSEASRIEYIPGHRFSIKSRGQGTFEGWTEGVRLFKFREFAGDELKRRKENELSK